MRFNRTVAFLRLLLRMICLSRGAWVSCLSRYLLFVWVLLLVGCGGGSNPSPNPTPLPDFVVDDFERPSLGGNWTVYNGDAEIINNSDLGMRSQPGPLLGLGIV